VQGHGAGTCARACVCARVVVCGLKPCVVATCGVHWSSTGRRLVPLAACIPPASASPQPHRMLATLHPPFHTHAHTNTHAHTPPHMTTDAGVAAERHPG
jgi:hypothetical protein